MKKLFLFAVIPVLLSPLLSFADFQIGPTIQYKTPISAASSVPGKDTISFNDFSIGADARLKLGLFQAVGYGLLNPGDPTFSLPGSVKLYLDGGLCFTLLILRLGVGLGPDFIFYFDNPSNNSQVNGNIRFAADITIGKIALGLNYLIEANLTPEGAHQAFEDIHGQLGLSVLFKIF